MHSFVRLFLLIFTFFFQGIALAQQGYISDVQAEKEQKYYEVFFYYETPKLTSIVTGKQIGRASCRERVYVLV